jgi:hypothetical protein
MGKMLFSKWPVFLVIVASLVACSPLGSKASTVASDSDGIAEQSIDLENYAATTVEAQAVIDGLKSGKKLASGFIDGGLTDELIRQRLEGAATSLSAKSVRPATKPATADTRPKIYWVGKKYGPAETYYVNAQITDLRIFDNNKPLTPAAYKETVWVDPNSGQSTYYDVALLQDTGAKVDFVGYQDPANDMLPFKILSMNPYGNMDKNYVQFMYDRSVPANNYHYTDLPSSVFEDPEGQPIKETWYWDPPWHFEKVSMKTNSSGETRYAVNTVEGFESQTLVYRWDKTDFNKAYAGTGGWHSQGWYIKDFDVENGAVTAILYKPSAAYTEVRMWGVTDDTFNARIGSVYWPSGYRGMMIDNSW